MNDTKLRLPTAEADKKIQGIYIRLNRIMFRGEDVESLQGGGVPIKNLKEDATTKLRSLNIELLDAYKPHLNPEDRARAERTMFHLLRINNNP